MSTSLSTRTGILSDVGLVLVRAGAMGAASLLVRDTLLLAQPSLNFWHRCMIISVPSIKRHELFYILSYYHPTDWLSVRFRLSSYGQVLLAWLRWFSSRIVTFLLSTQPLVSIVSLSRRPLLVWLLILCILSVNFNATLSAEVFLPSVRYIFI